MRNDIDLYNSTTQHVIHLLTDAVISFDKHIYF